ncbi:hypothetical protein BAUCODRAFT_108492 [Baudoinia panamericana UAMH 10762]|uniref:DASH complex subunit ASK1 n=1 Tax=Baudoinia panamericana (strain UAMH 10762) TaxID=717646 RepID=M2MJ19_BAUPA|nr:uncharacterized protein BAUCODRAFT_108492 [Baudoinia panamericana UAMH 10762]EMC96666.1 hypothetical protein BAUCODRAFT_108492 [Baudoinia panamericana UAMH 10762]
MSRQSSRNLTLYEELERLEQSITLTLQEIDSNFSKAHRIVTSSILPVVEQYAKHSNEVWEGSKFWKQFFEASANVSLSGYEEAPADDDVSHNETTTELETSDASDIRSKAGADIHDNDEDFPVDSPTQVTGVHSTPQLAPSTSKKAGSTSKAEASKPAQPLLSPSPRKYTGKNPKALPPSSDAPSTPGRQPNLYEDSSPFEPNSTFKPSAMRTNNDPLLHRILDKNYRVQATPHTQRRQERPQAVAPTPATTTRTVPWDDSPESSPAVAAPELRSNIFLPAKAPRLPGVSVLTPAHKAYTASKDRTSHTFFEGESDDEVDISPPKTMSFHVPQSRLLQTPAREASKRIVEELLLTAGADATDEIEADNDFIEEPSPSVVRRVFNTDDDTF